MDEPTSAEWVIGEWVTLDRELHPFEALELATVIEAVKLHVLHGWPRWWAWTFASLVAQIAIGILEGVFRRICGQNGGLVVPRQTHSVRVCSPPSRRVAPPPLRGATAWTPAPRTRVPALVVLLKEVWVG